LRDAPFFLIKQKNAQLVMLAYLMRINNHSMIEVIFSHTLEIHLSKIPNLQRRANYPTLLFQTATGLFIDSPGLFA